MKEILEQIKPSGIIPNIDEYDSNYLFYSILILKRYDLLFSNNINIHIDSNESTDKLLSYLLSDEDILWELYNSGYSFDNKIKDTMTRYILRHYSSDFIKFRNFIFSFFQDKDELTDYIKNNKEIFIEYLNNNLNNIEYSLLSNQAFITILLETNHLELIKNVDEFSIDNLKLLAPKLSIKNPFPYYIGNYRLAYLLFENIELFTSKEFIDLLSLLVYKNAYSSNREPNFEDLVNNNIDYLIKAVDENKTIPKCLLESISFRDYAIKNKRYDIAIKCLLPQNLLENEELMKSYADALGIKIKDLYERIRWVINYQTKNNTIFNTILGTSLTDIFNIDKIHFERFINDIDIQILLAKLNEKELKIITTILKRYDYNSYDISHMIITILNNIHDYKELISSLDITSLNEEHITNLIRVLSISENPYHINDLASLINYDSIKKDYFLNNINNISLDNIKDNLLKILFNIDLKEALYIDFNYCYDGGNNLVLDSIRDSELPKIIPEYLTILNKIISSNDVTELINIYNNITNIYTSDISLDAYLKASFTKLYSDSLYRIEERKDNVQINDRYNDKKVDIVIPKEGFKLFVHCVGSCSKKEDLSSSNYSEDWLDRPHLQDHFVACSYIDETGIYSIRSQGSIILGFNNLEGGCIMGMGNTDIDSIGIYSCAYDGPRVLQEGNGTRAKYYVPSEMLKTVKDSYNEIVIERRSPVGKENFKRKPDYIIMMTDSIDAGDLTHLDDIYNDYSFITNDDRQYINGISSDRELKSFLKKYKDLIEKKANEEGIDIKEYINNMVKRILQGKYYDDCLKAASEFDIPLLVIDKTYYFYRMLSESTSYDEKLKAEIAEFFIKANDSKKRQLYSTVAKGMDVSNILNSSSPKLSGFTISI